MARRALSLSVISVARVKAFFNATGGQHALLTADWNGIELFLTKIRSKCEISR